MSATPSLPQYRIRRDDGSELAVPWAAALALLVRRGDIRPDTVIFDAGKGVWSKASESPVVKFIIEEIAWSGQKLPPGWSEEATEPTPVDVGAAQAVLPDAKAPPADNLPAPWSGPGARGEAQVVPISSLPRWQTQLSPDADVETGTVVAVAVGERDVPAPEPGGISRVRRVFFLSFAGTVGVAVTLGLALRGGEPPAPEPVRPALPVTVFTPGFKSPDPGTGDFQEAGFAPVTQVFAETISAPAEETPLPPIPLPRPTIELLTDSQVASDLAVARTTLSAAPAVDLPPPPTPERPTDDVPFDVPPQVRNGAQIRQALEREYPIGLKETGVSGRVEMTFVLDASGVVERFDVRESSGHAALDQAAMRVAEVFQFAPARLRNERVPSSITLGITFNSRLASPTAAAVADGGRATPTAPQGAADSASQPIATPYDVPPQVRNLSQVRQALDREYPIGLRAARISGRVEVWFYIDEQGTVERFQVGTGSGNRALDQAALEVARVFQFTPARRGGQAIAVWVPVVIPFESR
jgi:TonB family protein